MRFGIHNSSWLDTPDPAEAFEAVKAPSGNPSHNTLDGKLAQNTCATNHDFA